MQKGFTLIELLIVIAIIVILAGVVLVAVNPIRRFAEARNSTRFSDVTSVLNATLKHQVDNDGTLLASIGSLTADKYYQIGTDTTGGCGCSDNSCAGQNTEDNCCDLTGLVDTYIGEIPEDPKTGSGNGTKTDYYILKSATGRLTIGACTPEDEGGTTPGISVTR